MNPKLDTIIERLEERRHAQKFENDAVTLALLSLLHFYDVELEFVDKQGGVDGGFHAMFRKIDIINSGVDFAIYNLLHACKDFWSVYQEIVNENERAEAKD